MSQAPSPMAFVPALMHTVGSYYPEAGIAAVPRALERAARRAGVGFHYGVKVQRICSENEKVVGVTTGSGEFIPASVVASNAAAIGTYLHLLDQVPEQTAELKKLPLQSPGVCAYLAVRGRTSRHYLRFKLGGHNDKCRLLIQPAVLGERQQHSDWHPARLLSPMDYDAAERSGPAGQLQFLERLLAEEWWRTGLSEVRIIATRTPQQWGSEYNLYANSMNPVMTARFMRHGRFAHRSPYVRGLYLAGSSTHPGQWVSFCAISGILAADRIIEDFS
jgi:phytoene dehydrogenase-like protein